jgi:hypothetical protein
MAVTLKRMDMAGMSIVYIPSGVATPEADVMKGPCRLYGILLLGDVTPSSTLNYIHLWDALNPTAGTDAPDYQFSVEIGLTRFVPCSLPDGIIFSTGLSVSANQSPGTQVGSSPTGALPLVLIVAPGVS